MKRVHISLEQIADRANLTLALHKAAQGKRHRTQVSHFLQHAEANLNQMAMDIFDGKLPYGHFRAFTIHDPKRRTIHAACFEDRIFHHALINLAGPVLERAMLPTSFACRPNLGVHRAAGRVQQCIRRYAWYCQIDISNYFANINHEILLAVLLRRFKGDEFSQQSQRLLDSYHHEPGKGLPIGSLTSQYFANYYLDGLDRLLDGLPQVRAHVRYMDDVVWWGDGKQQVKQVLQQVQAYLHGERQLHIKPAWKIQYSTHGISYCGYRILPGAVRLSVRRKRRYQQRRLYWERQYQLGRITANQLQTAYAAVHSILQGTNSSAWLRQNLHHHPPIPL
jgi:retron-type reverse transcriptase